MGGRDLARAPAEVGGRGDVGGKALQVTGAVLGLGADASGLRGLGEALRAEQRQGLERRGGRLLVVPALEAVEAVGAEDRPGHDSLGEGGHLGGLRHQPGDGSRFQSGRLFRDQGRGDPEPLGIELLALAEADDEHAGRGLGMQHRELLEACLGVRGAAYVGQLGRQLLVFTEPDGKQVGIDLRDLGLADGDLHRVRRVYDVAHGRSAHARAIVPVGQAALLYRAETRHNH